MNRRQEQFYQINRIVDKNIQNQNVHYLVDWKDQQKQTWESQDYLKMYIPEIIEQYNSNVDLQNKDSFNNYTSIGRNIQQDQGSFQKKDEIKKIIGIQKEQVDGQDMIYYHVKWKRRADNIKPTESYVSNHELKKYDIEALIDFYEEHLQLV